MVEMVGGCCVCSDEQGWNENPLVYCDGQGCNVAVHQGILQDPRETGYLLFFTLKPDFSRYNQIFHVKTGLETDFSH